MQIIKFIPLLLLFGCAQPQTIAITPQKPIEPDNIKVACPNRPPKMEYTDSYSSFITKLVNSYDNCRDNSAAKQNFIDILEK